MVRCAQHPWRALVPSAVLAAVCLAAPPGRPGHAADQAESKDRIKPLLQERLSTLKDIHEALVRAQARGAASADDVQQARGAVLRAQLDLYDTKEERLKMLEAIVKEAREWEQTTRKSVQSGSSPPIDGQRATLARIEAELALEKAKAAK
jgi:outer membrane protein TolC